MINYSRAENVALQSKTKFFLNSSGVKHTGLRCLLCENVTVFYDLFFHMVLKLQSDEQLMSSDSVLMSIYSYLSKQDVLMLKQEDLHEEFGKCSKYRQLVNFEDHVILCQTSQM